MNYILGYIRLIQNSNTSPTYYNTSQTPQLLKDIDKILILQISQIFPGIVICCLLREVFLGVIRDSLDDLHRLVYNLSVLSESHAPLLVLLVQEVQICGVCPKQS